MMGVAPEMPGSSTDHFTPSVGENFSGNPFSGEVPLKAGPLHWDQFSAWAERASAQARTRVWSFMGRKSWQENGVRRRLATQSAFPRELIARVKAPAKAPANSPVKKKLDTMA